MVNQVRTDGFEMEESVPHEDVLKRSFQSVYTNGSPLNGPCVKKDGVHAPGGWEILHPIPLSVHSVYEK